MPRKTVKVSELRDRVNGALLAKDSSLWLRAPGKDRELTPAEALRMGMISVLESVLHETGNYRGFGYQEMRRTEDGEYEIADETRRVYYG